MRAAAAAAERRRALARRSDDVTRMVRLAISAAQADGAMNEQERAAILQQATAAGAADAVAA